MSAMNDDDFVKQFQSRDIARADQVDAAKAAQRDAQAMEAHVRVQAKAEVSQFEPIARGLVDQINAGTDRLVMMPAAGGFAVKSGPDYATIYEAPPPYANVGVTSMIVNFTRMPSNFAAFGYGAPEYNDPHESRYIPRWDANAKAIAWHRDGRGPGLSTRALVQQVLTTLQERAA